MRLLPLIFVCVAVVAHAANPSFKDFSAKYFTTNGNVLGSTFTNYVWPTFTDNDASNINNYFSTNIVVILMPGTYTVTNRTGILLPTNGLLTSAGGPNSVNIINKNTNGLMGISLRQGATVEGVQVTNFFPNFCQACIGFHNNNSAGLASGPIGDNWTIRNSLTYGDCDNLHFVTTNGTRGGLIENCIAYARDDTVATSGNHSGTVDFVTKNCKIYSSSGPPTDGSEANAVSLSMNGSGTVRWTDYGSFLYASNGTAAGSCTISLNADGGTSPMIAVLNGSTIDSPSSSNTLRVITGGTLTLNNCSVQTSALLDPAKAANHGDGVFVFNPNVLATNIVAGFPKGNTAIFADESKYTITTFENPELAPSIQKDFVFNGADGSLSFPGGLYATSSQFTNTANFNYSNAWLTATNTRKANISRRGTWEVDFKFVDVVGGLPLLKVTIEDLPSVNTNVYFCALPGGLASTFTNHYSFRIPPGGVVSVTNLSSGTAGDAYIASSKLVWE